MPRLKITSGSQSGKTLDVAKATIIGRGDTAQLQKSLEEILTGYDVKAVVERPGADTILGCVLERAHGFLRR